MANTNTSRKSRVTSDDVVMTFLLEGASAVQLMLADHTNPVKCLDDAMRKILQKNDHQDVKDLKDIRTAFSKANTLKGRGAVGLRQGTTKTYSVQQVGEKGDLFIRLPVALLVSHKGAQVQVEACADGTLRVTRA